MWLGFRPEDSTIEVYFTTHNSSGAAVAPSAGFNAADVDIYKNGSDAQKATGNGLTMTSPFDATTGLHLLQVDTSVDTGDAGFWESGARYSVILDPNGKTVDGQAVVRVLAEWQLGPAPANTTQLAGSAVQQDAGYIKISEGTGTGQLDLTSGRPGIDWQKVSNPTSTVTLSATTIGTATNTGTVTGDVNGAVGSVTGAVGSVTGNVGGNVVGSTASVTGAVGSVTGNVGGNVTGSVGSVATGGITAASFGANAVNAAALASDAVIEIQSGLATAAKLQSYVQLLARKDAAIATDKATELGEINNNEGTGAGSYDNATDSQEAIRDQVGGAGALAAILNVTPLIPAAVDVADTATYRLGLMLTDAIDDLPDATTEITPGTISIDRKAIGGTSWSSVVADGACLESNGLVYFDETFSTVRSYVAGDSVRITFKSQVVTVGGNDYEISDATGRIFYTYIRSTTLTQADILSDATPFAGAQIALINTGVDTLETRVPNALNMTASGNIGVNWASVENATNTTALPNTTVGTVTTNTDMRGTDNAALATTLNTKVPNNLNTTVSGNIGVNWGSVENAGSTVGLSATTVGTVTTNTDMRGTNNAALATTLDTKVPNNLNTTASGNIGIDWASVENATNATVLSGTTVGTTTAVTNRVTANTDQINGSGSAAVQLALSAGTIVSGAAIAGTLSVTQMSTNLTEATNDHYLGRIIIWTSGALQNQATDVTAYDGATKILTFTQTTESTSPGDTFVLV